MAESQSHERRASELDSAFTSQNQTNPSKFYSYFLCKSTFIAIFIALLSFFPYKAPEFINQTFITRSWEVIHLLFVGIAISYGLFSRRNLENEKENQSKLESTETYVSKILNFSSVFDDEVQIPSGSDENKIQTWNSQYFRGEPAVVVKQETTGFDHNCEKISQKSLRLPVRSLRSRISDPEVLDFDDKISGFLGSDNESGSVSMCSSIRKSKIRDGIGETEDVDTLNLEQKLEENAVYRSPIRRRSQSARMERTITPMFSPEKKNISRSFKDEYVDSSSRGDWMSDEDLDISFFMSKSKPKNYVEGSLTGRSVKATESKSREISEDEMEEETEKRSEAVETAMLGKLEAKTGSDQSSIGSVEIITESEDSDSSEISEISDIEDEALISAVGSKPNTNEVDKKADEFIAKFKEQMRLQRTTSIDKTSSRQHSGRNSR